ncbi:tail fiber domain-containing protein [Sinorhizobium psoraleae]|uniref:Tail fiber domain-containing protein n=1 Tax=Sinorhizobium psoraleae TaxID=520838 RepID=A0ABT4KBP0_9HYPH|nr:tail fiber domain-containing protein [Sinorhizobium psoraleae]MCZ4089327.1 tail fiber domain-containing protein [Sinorhizobium psoraleae]
MVSTPKAPDPQQTANAQAGMNRDTAITQQQLNMVDQQGPYGSLTYTQSGTNKFKNAQGQWVETPKYTATTTLSPEQQKILEQTQAANLNLGTIANERSSFLKDYLAKPFDVNAQTEAKLYDLGSKRLDPRFAEQQEALRTQLINSGIRPGSAAYTSALRDFEANRNDAYNQLALTGRQQAFQEASYERAQPLNEISALLSGAQVQQPSFVSTPQTSVGGVDYTGLVNNKYQSEVAQSNARMGGLFGLAAAPFGMFSFGANEWHFKTFSSGAVPVRSSRPSRSSAAVRSNRLSLPRASMFHPYRIDARRCARG